MSGPPRTPEEPDPGEPRRRTAAGAAILVTVLGLLTASGFLWSDASGPPPPGSPVPQVRRAAVVLVAAVCGVSSLGGWFLARLGAAEPALAVSRSLAAILLRLLLPLLLLGWLSAGPAAGPRAAELRDAGAGGVLVVFYLTLLATDILLHIMWGPKGRRPPPRRPADRDPRSLRPPPAPPPPSP